MLEFIGIVVVTGVLAYATCAVLALFYYMVIGFMEPSLGGYTFALVLTVPCVVGCYFWWEHIGSKINVSFG